MFFLTKVRLLVEIANNTTYALFMFFFLHKSRRTKTSKSLGVAGPMTGLIPVFAKDEFYMAIEATKAHMLTTPRCKWLPAKLLKV